MVREFRIAENSVDEAKRTAVVSFSSEFPVLRRDFSGREFWEVLDHESVDMSRLADGAPLLFGHREHIGIVDAAAIGPDKRGRAIVRFSESQLGQEKFRDVVQRILIKTSVGYDLSHADYVADGERGGIPIYRFRGWQPYEVTLTPLPADPTGGLGRERTNPPVAITSLPMPEEIKPTTAPAAALPAPTDSLARQKDLRDAANILIERHPQHKEAIIAVRDKCCFDTGDDVAAFYRSVVNDILATKQELAPVRQDPAAATLGLSEKDKREYSILKAVRAIMANKPLEGREREFNDELTRRLERQPKGFFVPDDILADRRGARRTMTVGTPSAGGYTVGQEILTGEFEEYLRNNTVVLKLGGRMISGLVGDVSIPRQLTGASAYWVSETGSITASEATFGQIVGKPRRVGTSVPYSKQFLAQTTLAAESFVVNDSDAAIAVDLDRVALRGTGGAEPLGIANLASGDRSTSVTFGAAPTWAKYLEFFSSIAANNALLGAPAYAASVASAVKAMATAKFTNTGVPIWDNGRVGAFRAEWTTQLLTSATPVANMVIFGDFSQVLFLEWAGRDVVVDPYAGKKEGTVEITIQRLMDVVIRRAKSFAISTDSGAQ